MELNQLLVLDLETTSLDVETTQIIEIACLTIDMAQVKPIPKSFFSSTIKPEDFSSIEPSALVKNGITIQELQDSPPVSVVLKKFSDHVGRFFKGKTKSQFNAPYLGGKNIKNFDMPILTRYCNRFGLVDAEGEPKMFSRKWFYDIEDDLFRWMGQTGELKSLSMDSVLSYFGITDILSHRAGNDVKITAWFICRFLRMYRTLSNSVHKGMKDAVSMKMKEEIECWGL